MPKVYDQRGAIATESDGKWTGSRLPEAQKGLEAVTTVVDRYSRADKTGDESEQDTTTDRPSRSRLPPAPAEAVASGLDAGGEGLT